MLRQYLPDLVLSPLHEKLAHSLYELNCCHSCVLRFLGNRQAHQHQVFPKEETCLCPACLGFLQMDIQSICEKGNQVFLEKKFELSAQTFSVSTQLPNQLSIRQALFKLYLKEKIQQDLPEPIEVKEIFKYKLRDTFQATSGLTFDVDSPLSFITKLTHQETDLDFQFMTEIPKLNFKVNVKRAKGKTVYQGASGDKINYAAKLLNFEDIQSVFPPSSPTHLPIVQEQTFEHSQLYVAGRYCKLERNISNSVWILGGKRMTEHSVEELIGLPLDEYFRADTHKFSSAGREDADVLMLGLGRPFYFELVRPHKTVISEPDMAQLERQINEAAQGKVSVRDLQLVSRSDTSVLKDSASTKSKSYQCKVQLIPPQPRSALEQLSGTRDLPVSQRNPTRVPRRADLVRDKVIEELILIPETFHSEDESLTDLVSLVTVDLKTSAGTYVKEFMHSDQGRTEPSLKSLLGCEEVKVRSLDVLEIHLDWPKRMER